MTIRGPVTEELRSDISAGGFTLFGNHAGGTLPPGGQNPEPTNHILIGRAASAKEARERVQAAFKDRAVFVAEDVRPGS